MPFASGVSQHLLGTMQRRADETHLRQLQMQDIQGRQRERLVRTQQDFQAMQAELQRQHQFEIESFRDELLQGRVQMSADIEAQQSRKAAARATRGALMDFVMKNHPMAPIAAAEMRDKQMQLVKIDKDESLSPEEREFARFEIKRQMDEGLDKYIHEALEDRSPGSLRQKAETRMEAIQTTLELGGLDSEDAQYIASHVMMLPEEMQHDFIGKIIEDVIETNKQRALTQERRGVITDPEGGWVAAQKKAEQNLVDPKLNEQIRDAKEAIASAEALKETYEAQEQLTETEQAQLRRAESTIATNRAEIERLRSYQDPSYWFRREAEQALKTHRLQQEMERRGIEGPAAQLQFYLDALSGKRFIEGVSPEPETPMQLPAEYIHNMGVRQGFPTTFQTRQFPGLSLPVTYPTPTTPRTRMAQPVQPHKQELVHEPGAETRPRREHLADKGWEIMTRPIPKGMGYMTPKRELLDDTLTAGTLDSQRRADHMASQKHRLLSLLTLPMNDDAEAQQRIAASQKMSERLRDELARHHPELVEQFNADLEAINAHIEARLEDPHPLTAKEAMRMVVETLLEYSEYVHSP